MDFSNIEAPVISSSSTNEVVDVNLPKNNDISDLIPKVEENKPAVELPKTEEEKKEEQINVDEVFDKYIKDEGVISLYFHNKLYIDYKERQEIVNDEALNNNILKQDKYRTVGEIYLLSLQINWNSKLNSYK